MKKCKHCGLEMPHTVEFFAVERRVKSGLTTVCRKCMRLRAKKSRDQNLDRYRAYARDTHRKNPQKHAARAAKWAAENRERYNENMRVGGAKWRAKNADYLKEARRKYHNKTRHDGKLRLVRNMSIYLRQSLKRGKEGRSWERLVGYTRADLALHLERQFEAGMNWDNFGPSWHIDHIVPIKSFSFDSADSREFAACWALSNLRPLSKMENLSKSSIRTHLL